MNKRAVFLILAVIVLGAVYVLKFTDWFAEKDIHIIFHNRGNHGFFGLENREYKLTSVKVFNAQEISTNKYARPLWHMIPAGEKTSKPVSEFNYGEPIPGMKSAVDGMLPMPLQRNEKYRVVLESESQSGQLDFQVR